MHQVTMMATMPAKKMNTPHFMLQSMVTKHWPMTKVKSCTAEDAVSNALAPSAVEWRWGGGEQETKQQTLPTAKLVLKVPASMVQKHPTCSQLAGCMITCIRSVAVFRKADGAHHVGGGVQRSCSCTDLQGLDLSRVQPADRLQAESQSNFM